MKKGKKRLVSLLLVGAMLFTGLPQAVFAEGAGSECICTEPCAEDNINADCPVCGAVGALPEDCGKYQAPELDGGTEESETPTVPEPSAAEQVQALIGALPTAQELATMSQEERQAAYDQIQAAYDAYEALTDEEKENITGAEIFEELFAVFNGMTDALEDGDFEIAGGTVDSDYTYSGGVLTVKNNADLTISMKAGSETPTTDRIVVDQGASATITLNGVHIGVPDDEDEQSPHPAIDLSSESSLKIILTENSKNTLSGGNSETDACEPGIHVPAGTSLTVQCANKEADHRCGDECGTLSVTGGEGMTPGVGIGGKSGTDSGNACGTVLLLGGNITVKGGEVQSANPNTPTHATDIGGGSGSPYGDVSGGAGGTIIILTNVTTGVDDRGLEIGGGTGSNPGAAGNGIKPSTDEKDTYEVYGNLELPNPPASYTIPEGVTLVIPDETSLEIPEGVTLINQGTITGEGALTGAGTFQNSGTVSVETNDFKSDSKITLTLKKDNTVTTEFTYGDTITIEGNITEDEDAGVASITDALSPPGINYVALFLGDTQLTEPAQVTDGTFTINYDTSKKGIKPSESEQTLTVQYGGSGELKEETATAQITLKPKEITAKINVIEMKTYDGTTSVPGTMLNITVEGNPWISGDSGSVTAPYAAFSDKNVGHGKPINLNELVVSGDCADFYVATCKDQISGVINQCDLTVRLVGTTSKDYDGTTAAPEGASIQLSPVTTVQGEDNYYATADISYNDPNVGSRTLSASNIRLAGTDAGNYMLPASTGPLTVTASGTINRATAQPNTGTLTVTNDLERTYTFDLATLLPTLEGPRTFGEVAYNLGEVSLGAYYTDNTASISGSTLNLPINNESSGNEGQIGTVTITISSDNYQDMTATINVSATDKEAVQITGVTAQNGTYNGQPHTGYTGTPGNDGGYVGGYNVAYYRDGVYCDTAPPTDAGSYIVTISIPESEYEGSISLAFTIAKAQPTGAPSYTAITSGGKTLADAALTTVGGTFSVPGRVAWELPDTTKVQANTAYQWIFTPKDSDNYEVLTGTATLWRYSSGTIYYALLFETNGGSKIGAVVHPAGTVLDLSAYIPTREGYDFTGWYEDEEQTKPVTEIRLDTTKTIYAGWEKTDTRQEQEIYMTVPAQERDLKNGSRTTKSKVCTLKLGFEVEDKDMNLTYATSDPKVATVKDGKITYQGVGTCTITVTAKATDTCKEASLAITVKVGKPGTPTFTPSVTSRTAKKAFVVTSSTVRGVDGWEVQYSVRPDFWKATTKDFSDTGAKLYRKTCTTVHSRKTYYIHVRGYQMVDGKKVYSDWSPMKTIQTK